MNEKILIIGINGVGKEHIRACENLNISYDLFDIDVSEFIGKKEIWNIWGNHKNLVKLNNCGNIYSKFTDINLYSYTHAIISTPDDFHSYYVEKLFLLNKKIKILVEKPPQCDLKKVEMVGYSDFEFPVNTDIKELIFNVEKVEKFNSNWKNLIELDLLGHLYYSYLQYYKNRNIDIDDSCQIKSVVSKSEDKLIVELNNNVILHVQRKMKDTYLVINGIERHNDYNYIFTKQMCGFVFLNYINIVTCYFIENEIKRLYEII